MEGREGKEEEGTEAGREPASCLQDSHNPVLWASAGLGAGGPPQVRVGPAWPAECAQVKEWDHQGWATRNITALAQVSWTALPGEASTCRGTPHQPLGEGPMERF